MSGKYSRNVIPGNCVGGTVITSEADLAKTTAFSFSVVSSSKTYDPLFRLITGSAQTTPVYLNPLVTAPYNTTVGVDELAALERCRYASPGPESIQNKMLSHFPFVGMEFLSRYTTMCGRTALCQMPGEKLL
jgi:hypothetical protein